MDGSVTEKPDSSQRLTQLARGGGCACKIPPGELEALMAGISFPASDNLLVGLDSGDDACAVRITGGLAVLSTTDFFTPVVDDPYDWGRIAAANALSDVYAMGGVPVLAINLLAWPREILPAEIITEVVRGGADIAREAGTPLAGGHSIDAPEPLYGLAVTGTADPARLLRNDTGKAGLPITLTKPLGVGILNNRHKTTGEMFPQAVASMTTLNREASAGALAAGVTTATDVTGFGLLGHLFKMMRASGISAVVDSSAVPYLDGARQSLVDGFVPGGSQRNLDWVRPHLDARVDETELLLLADAQTSGGLLLLGEVPGGTVIGHTVSAQDAAVVVR